jgi:hypothetical protein
MIKKKALAVSKKPELFPAAQAPGATSLKDVFAQWKRRGLEPVEVTRAETIQRITIEHDPLDGKLTWKTSGPMDGLMTQLITVNALMLMPSLIVADAAVSIAGYFTTGKGRVDLGTGTAAVMIGFENGKLVLDWQPKDAPIAAKKLLAAALLFMIAKDAGLPMENLLKSLGWKPAVDRKRKK